MYAIFVLFLCLLFFIVYSHYLGIFNEKRNQQGYREIKEAYKRVIKRHRMSVSAVDRFSDRLIAIDWIMGKLVLIIYKEGVTWEKSFNMDEILFCRIVKTTDKINGNIQKVNMELTVRNDNAKVEFPFFDEKMDGRSVLAKRLRKSQSWKTKIQFQVSTRQRNSIDNDQCAPGKPELIF
jgi:hypothetical protein